MVAFGDLPYANRKWLRTRCPGQYSLAVSSAHLANLSSNPAARGALVGRWPVRIELLVVADNGRFKACRMRCRHSTRLGMFGYEPHKLSIAVRT